MIRPSSRVKPNTTFGAPPLAQTAPAYPSSSVSRAALRPAGEGLRHRLRTRGHCGRPHPHRPGVRPDHRVGVEQVHERLEVAAPRGGEERLDHPSLGRRSASGALVAEPAPGAVPGWRAGVRRPTSGPSIGRDLVERQREQVVQHERQPLRRRQRLEHDQQRPPDRVGQLRLVLRMAGGVGADRLAPARLLASGSSRRVVRARSRSRQIRETTVVSQPPRFSIAVARRRCG